MNSTASFDIVVVGAGHAGCEAALAAARLGVNTCAVTLSADKMALMPCNCSIGGSAKGQVVREIDALGGQMALVADATTTHRRMLNTGKGPAVQALRVQCDTLLYRKAMREAVVSQPGLTLIEDRVACPRRRAGARCAGSGSELQARAVIVPGTFLNGVCHCEVQTRAGRRGEPCRAFDSLCQMGFPVGLKTGTTARRPRVARHILPRIQPSDPSPLAFSYLTPPKSATTCFRADYGDTRDEENHR